MKPFPEFTCEGHLQKVNGSLCLSLPLSQIHQTPLLCLSRLAPTLTSVKARISYSSVCWRTHQSLTSHSNRRTPSEGVKRIYPRAWKWHLIPREGPWSGMCSGHLTGTTCVQGGRMEFSSDPNLSPCGSNPVRPVALPFNLCPSVGLCWLIRYYPALITIPTTNLHLDYKAQYHWTRLFSYIRRIGLQGTLDEASFPQKLCLVFFTCCRSSLSFLHLDSLLLKSPHSIARLIALGSKSTLQACLLTDAILRSLYTHTIILCWRTVHITPVRLRSLPNLYLIILTHF